MARGAVMKIGTTNGFTAKFRSTALHCLMSLYTAVLNLLSSEWLCRINGNVVIEEVLRNSVIHRYSKNVNLESFG